MHSFVRRWKMVAFVKPVLHYSIINVLGFLLRKSFLSNPGLFIRTSNESL